MAQLGSLVQGGSLTLKGVALGDHGAQALAAALRDLEGLQTLNLAGSHVGCEGAAALAAVLPNSGVEALNLSSNEVGCEGATSLARALGEARLLKRLNLATCGIGDAGALALAKALPAAGLQSLTLRCNQLSQSACEAVIDAARGSSLTELSLTGNSADTASLAALEAVLTRNAMLNCEGLACDLRGRGLGDTAAQAISEVLGVGSPLTSIDLRGNHISSQGALAISQSLQASPSLTQVCLGGCPADGTPEARGLLGRLAVNALKQALGAACGRAEREEHAQQAAASGAEGLRVAGDRGLGDEGAEEVATWLRTGPPLTALGLQHNAIGARGARAIAAALPQLTALRELLLYSNSLGVEGATGVVAALPPQLTALDIGSNSLSDEGAAAVAAVLEQRGRAGPCRLAELHLDYNGIGPAGAGRLLQALASNSFLTKLWLHGNTVGEDVMNAIEAVLERNRAQAPAADTVAEEAASEEQQHQQRHDCVFEIPASARTGGSCAFADRVSHLAASAYLSRAAGHALGARGQVVLAAILVHRPRHRGADASLEVASFGVGTKFMPKEVAKADTRRRECVRDSHAEVLARRAFLRYLYAEITRLLQGHAGSDDSSILELEPGSPSASRRRCRLKEGVTLHLYVSSAPCGWASVSSSAAGAPRVVPPCWPELGDDEFPVPPVEEVSEEGISTSQPLPLLAKGAGDCLAPPGCVQLASACEALGVDGVCLSCSDKIARWQASGLQGALLSRYIEEPMQLSSITVGRKFDYRSCLRALRWPCAEEALAQQLRPLAVMQSGAPLEALITAARGHAPAGIQFEKGDGDESLVWTAGDEVVSRHDGRTGGGLAGTSQGNIPCVARAKFLALENGLRSLLGEPPCGSLGEAKLSAPPRWREARGRLLLRPATGA